LLLVIPNGSIARMDSADGFGALVEHLERTTRLSHAEAERVVAEVLDYFSESLEAFVTRRHAELQGEELRNPEIFARLLAETRQRRFAAPTLSERQVRRMVYG
jgi:hypothetical protein